MPPACVYRLVVWPLTLLRVWPAVSCTSPCTATLVSWPLNRLMVAGVTNAAVTGVSKCTKGLANFSYGVGQGATLGF